MSQDGFILRSVLFGIFLGLAIIAGWMHYPRILPVFHSAVPVVTEYLTAIRDKMEVKDASLSRSADKKEKKGHIPAGDVSTAGVEVPAPTKQMVQDLSRTPAPEKQTMYPFWWFDERTTAEDFMAKIQKRTGVDLTLGQEGYRYVIYIPAASEEEKRQKADLIERETGIIGLKHGGL
ncbi:MAG: hypothetical protein U9N82_05115 [Thermodesulfobacteriota bacterium]|nr:hypothetical protein [Thermodesulfobacteriota bacterium]